MCSHLVKVMLAMAVVLMTACSESPKPAEATSAAAGSSAPVSGKTAFWAMFKSAYSWSKDIVPLKLESKDIPEAKNDNGDAGMWSATFGSFARHQALEITYAVAAHAPDIRKGINVGHPMSWGGPSPDVMPFQTSDLVIDSDAAYKTALAQAEPWLKKHPDKEVSLLMGNNHKRFADPVWYVLWGDNKSGYSVFVDSKTGAVTKPVR